MKWSKSVVGDTLQLITGEITERETPHRNHKCCVKNVLGINRENSPKHQTNRSKAW
jgi:hypothetical protein